MEQAFDEIKKYSETQFDPEIVSIFLKTSLDDWGKIRERAYSPAEMDTSSLH
jgi:response regulator RpfG family c-di-GMP phosphodiesterase